MFNYTATEQRFAKNMLVKSFIKTFDLGYFHTDSRLFKAYLQKKKFFDIA
jgi:hypothetical protein